jgi:hypothetical protein
MAPFSPLAASFKPSAAIVTSSVEDSYTALDSTPGTIRLLQVLPSYDNNLNCRLLVGNVETSDFKALSYTWGSPNEEHTIVLNGQRKCVRKNLFAFLQKAQVDYPYQLLWIDALCINQDDLPERNQQVRLMPQVYGEASEVLVWLDVVLPPHVATIPLYPVVYRAFSGMPIPATWNDVDGDLMDEIVFWVQSNAMNAKDLLIAIKDLAYWSRIWVIQEFCLPDTVSLVFPNAMISFEQFQYVYLCASRDPVGARLSRSESLKAIWNLIDQRRAHRDIPSLWLETDTYRSPIRSLYHTLVRFGSRDCADIRDKVFGLVGISDEAKTFPIDYAQSKVQLAIEVLYRLDNYVGRYESFSNAKLVTRLLDLSPQEVLDDIRNGRLHNQKRCDPEYHGYQLGCPFYTATAAQLMQSGIWKCTCESCQQTQSTLSQDEEIVVCRIASNGPNIFYRRMEKIRAKYRIWDETSYSFIGVAINSGGLCTKIGEEPAFSLLSACGIIVNRVDRGWIDSVRQTYWELYLEDMVVFAFVLYDKMLRESKPGASCGLLGLKRCDHDAFRSSSEHDRYSRPWSLCGTRNGY